MSTLMTHGMATSVKICNVSMAIARPARRLYARSRPSILSTVLTVSKRPTSAVSSRRMYSDLRTSTA